MEETEAEHSLPTYEELQSKEQIFEEWMKLRKELIQRQDVFANHSNHLDAKIIIIYPFLFILLILLCITMYYVRTCPTTEE